MRIAAEYSFKDGLLQLGKHHSSLLTEVREAINAVTLTTARVGLEHGDSRSSRTHYHRAVLDRAFKKELYTSGWEKVLVACKFHRKDALNENGVNVDLEGAFRELDFVKNRVGVELQLHSLPVCSICATMTVFRNLGFIDYGIGIVPMQSLTIKMGSDVPCFEQFVWDLEERGVSNIDIPILVIGIAVT